MSLQINIRGDKELLAKLRKAGGFLNKELVEAMNKAVVVVHKRAATYPPARPSSSYRRTRRLGNSWDMEVKPLVSEVRGIVDNPTDYGGYVMDPTDQAWMHKGRWATTQKILKEKQQQIVGFFETAVKNIVRWF